jgi:hypothetical protein
MTSRGAAGMLRPRSHGGGVSIEGGIPGRQQRLVCPKCGKVFFAWRPDEVPGVKVKCYFCRNEFADEAALRPVPAPPAPPAPAETPLADAAAAATPPGPAGPPPGAETEPAN